MSLQIAAPLDRPHTQAESIGTLQFAARCTRVVVRQCVNEVASDALLLKRARSQITDLRRRLRQLETTSTKFEYSPTSAALASTSSGDAVRYQKNKPSAATPSGAGVERKHRFHDSVELDRGKLGSDDLGLPGVSQSAAETAGGQLHRATGKYNRNDEAPEPAKKTLDIQRGRDLMIQRSPPEGRDQPIASLNTVWSRGDCTTHERTANSKGWKPRTVISRSRKHSPPVERDDADAVAMAALLERFSSREGELLREIESWKTKCNRVERESRGDRGAVDVFTSWSECKRSASTATPAPLSQPAVAHDSSSKSHGPGEASEASARMTIAQTRYPRGRKRSASPRRQESKGTHRERKAEMDNILPGRKKDLEPRQVEAVEVVVTCP